MAVEERPYSEADGSAGRARGNPGEADGSAGSAGRLADGTRDLLNSNPALVPALLATGVFLVLAGTEAGFYPTSWYAGALFLVGLLAASLIALGPPRGLPRATLVAVALLAAFAVWSFLSITWASQPALAWDGANRTVTYVVVFALFALWPFDSRGVMAVLGLLGFGIAGIGLVELLKANSSAEPLAYFIDVRFAEPAGYMNANVALWTLGLLPCVFLSSRRGVPVPLRGLALGGAGVLTGLALMGQSRGWVLALPLALAFFLIVCPGRVRLLAAMAAVAVAGLAIRAPALAVHDDFDPQRFDALLSDATGAILIAAAALTLLGLLAGVVDRRVEPGPVATRRIGWAAAALVALVLGGGVIGYAATEGSPSGRIGEAWDDFKGGGLGPQAGGSRFAGGGTNRYDFWTVAWAAFKDKPVQGLGSENFQEEYLEKGVSGEQPRFPHSLELGVLSQTGLPGALLLFGGLGFAVAAAIRARAAPRPARAAAAAAAALFAYWLAHASVDWFWEFLALTAPGLAGLALAGALAPRAATGRARPRPALLVAGGLVTLVVCLSLALPWLAELEVDRAASSWAANPDAALRRLDRAESLNPLSARAPLTAATIALRLDRRAEAEREFRVALEREPRNVYPLLYLGVIEAARDRQGGLRLVARARELSPRDPVIRRAERRLRRGRSVNLDSLSREIVETADELGTAVD
ncbi:MAG TPA: O-antigen ligase family protein [Thermoleophilaceae bacterium]|nr:O-antigen ligase family protein [Thermoleophilaceae bacterium]